MFGFAPWVRQFPHQETGRICGGFGERWAAAIKNVSNGVKDMSSRDPWWASGCIGPQGSQPELLDLFVTRCRQDAIAWEQEFIGMCPNDGFARHDPGSVMPHVMFRTYLSQELRDDARVLLKDHYQTYLLRDVHTVAGLLAWDVPVRLLDWAPAYVSQGRWDAQSRTATISLSTVQPAMIRLAVRAPAATIKADVSILARQTAEWDDWRVLEFELSPGDHVLRAQLQ